MPVSIPCLGYKSRSAAISAMRADGVDTDEIMRQLGIEKKSTLTTLEATARWHRRKMLRIKFSMLKRDVDALQPHADKRGMTASALAERLITTALADNLVDAILDDRVQA